MVSYLKGEGYSRLFRLSIIHYGIVISFVTIRLKFILTLVEYMHKNIELYPGPKIFHFINNLILE